MLETLYQLTANFFQILLNIPFDYTERFYPLYIATFVGFAYLGFRHHHNTRRSFWKFLFAREIYLHPSAIIDYLIYLVNLFISPVTALFGVAVNTSTSIIVANTLIGYNNGNPLVSGEWNYSVNLLFILGFTLIADFTVYLVHRLHHQLDILWPIHALHHSAEVLTPVTLFRKHPLWNFTTNLATALLTGLFQGVFIFIFYGKPDYTVLLGISTIYVLYNFFASNLRHSHIWLEWGKPLSYIFISPAMHQIHHDCQRMHKNYGEVFALWDWLFGTLYIPNGRERFTIGLPDGNPHTSLAKAYYVPLAQMATQTWRKLRLRS